MLWTRGEHYADIPASFAVLRLVVLFENRAKYFFILGLQQLSVPCRNGCLMKEELHNISELKCLHGEMHQFT